METLLLFNGTTNTSFYDPTISDINWNPFTGSSWAYYINSSDYKLEEHGEIVVADILVAGIDKKDIKAYLEGSVLTVKTDKPGWNGNVYVEINLLGHKIDLKNPKVKLSNGVLRVEFPKIDEKRELEIK